MNVCLTTFRAWEGTVCVKIIIAPVNLVRLQAQSVAQNGIHSFCAIVQVDDCVGVVAVTKKKVYNFYLLTTFYVCFLVVEGSYASEALVLPQLELVILRN